MYCPFCGEQAPEESLFCCKCGKALNEKSAPQDGCRVTIFRKSQMYVLNPPVNVCIDGERLLSVANGATEELELSKGNHTFDFSSSLRKKSLNLNIEKDTTIMLEWNRLTGSLVANVK
jgi:hypothetical protein